MSIDRETRLGILARRVAKLKAQRAEAGLNERRELDEQLALVEAVLELYTRSVTSPEPVLRT